MVTARKITDVGKEILCKGDAVTLVRRCGRHRIGLLLLQNSPTQHPM